MLRFGRTKKSDSLRRYLLEAVKFGRKNFVGDTAQLFSVSRQTVHRHLAHLIAEGYLTAEGTTKNRVYHLGTKRWYGADYDLSKIDESTVHRQDFHFVFAGLPSNTEEICHYGFTEMVNNAIDHSEGTEVYIEAKCDGSEVFIGLFDNGEGIFRRIARILELNDPRESRLELSKGKLTTDPDNHTGEGIFFTSRAFDDFVISSGDLDFSHCHRREHDFLYHADNEMVGTAVAMWISVNSERDLEGVFDEYSSGPDDYRFERTVVPVRLVLYEGERLVSRSQAKRLLNRVERFRHVVLDFEGVDTIGQAFADEVFRVFPNRHPEIDVAPVNMSKRVVKMVNRALAELKANAIGK